MLDTLNHFLCHPFQPDVHSNPLISFFYNFCVFYFSDMNLFCIVGDHCVYDGSESELCGIKYR